MSDSEDDVKYTLEDASELSELDDEEFIGKTSSKASSKKKDKGTDWTLKDALKPCRATTYTTEALSSQIDDGTINLDAEYQRDVVWTPENQVDLIESIFRNYYVPPVIFHVRTNDDGSEERICIDGKQRLTSIHRFISGDIPFRDRHTKQSFWYRLNSRKGKNGKMEKPKGRKLLPEQYRRIFANKQVVSVEYADLTPENERDIFTRVQKGKVLTPAEKLKVIDTPRSVFVRDLVAKYVTGRPTGLGSDAIWKWDRERALGMRWIGTAAQMISLNLKSVRSITQLHGYQAWLNNDSPIDPAYEQDVTSAFDHVHELLEGPSSYRRTWQPRKKMSPIELVSIIYMVHVLTRDKGLSLDQIGVYVEQLRREVREEFQEVRTNNKTCYWLIDYIKRVVGAASNGDNKKRKRASPIKGEPTDTILPDSPLSRLAKVPALESPSSIQTPSLSHALPSRSRLTPSHESLSTAPSLTNSIQALKAARATRLATTPAVGRPSNPQNLPSPSTNHP